jgi:DNA mismatch endonuclease (patch repair protein)
MSDVVSPRTRSRMMAGIRGKNTRPEWLIRSGLHALGFRYRLHNRKLPGKPDLVLSKYRAVIFIHGCFWHRHGCHLFKWPATRPEFWRNKLDGNHAHDQKVRAQLREAGWRVCIVWECMLKGKQRDLAGTIGRIAAWLPTDTPLLELSALPTEPSLP